MSKTFRVQVSRFGFPVDMLRYDSCWPASEQDSALIAASLHEPDTLPRIIVIALRTDERMAPTVARWASFMCKVVD